MTDITIYRDILQNMREGVLSVDLNGKIITFNQAAERILNLRAKDVIGEIFGQVFFSFKGSDDFIQAVLNTIYQSRTIHHKRIKFSIANKNRILTMTTSFLYGDASDNGERKKSGVIAVFGDITEAERMKSKLKALKKIQVEQIVRAYRQKGHVMASLDPLGVILPSRHEDLELSRYGLDNSDLENTFSILLGKTLVTWPLHKILTELNTVYCQAVGIQYMHIDDLVLQQWLREKIEDPDYRKAPSRNIQLQILKKLTDAEAFETFLHKTFTHTKRFSLEGAETLIPLLDQTIERASKKGVEEIVIGMPHRGRLNVLVNLLGLPAKDIFRRFSNFEDSSDPKNTGDVPVHLGQETIRTSDGGHSIKLSLCFNPSHLEFVGPVVLGRVRARLDKADATKTGTILPLIIHGDAAFAGQGINQELLNLSGLSGYTTGGAVHVILNNQIGFTTQPDQGRSTHYASDVARMLQVPILHVNGERPEAVNLVMRLALDFWQTWQRDIIIDMYCFRRHGHMELDDPTVTQPLLYKAIAKRPPIRKSYMANLVRLGKVTPEEAKAIADDSDRILQAGLKQAKTSAGQKSIRKKFSQEKNAPETNVPKTDLSSLIEELSTPPDNLKLHPKVKAIMRRRLGMAKGKNRLDWATGETLAYATLLGEGLSVRISGQDSQRGTFAHRHAVLFDQETGASYTPLANLSQSKADFSIYNSPLTEAGVLAFEFGFSIDQPAGIVVWEAQFGDFANGAQVIIDQFITSSEAKWQQPSSLCLFLPHGLEGNGPEHSSARPERFLQLAACTNIEIVCLSTASQVFHRLRLQGLRKEKRPLIVFTPKRMLHSPAACSPLDDFAKGRFEPILFSGKKQTMAHLFVCYGQFGAELENERKKHKKNVGILRLEQLYPFPQAELEQCISDAPRLHDIVWAQEEPENMGPWNWVRPKLKKILGSRHALDVIARPESPSPATGSPTRHKLEHQRLMESLFK